MVKKKSGKQSHSKQPQKSPRNKHNQGGERTLQQKLQNTQERNRRH
jgi:hypothetical protein